MRRNYMVPIPEGKSIEELNEKILKQCYNYGHHKIEGRNRIVIERFESKRQNLIKIPKIPLSNIQLRTPIIDKYSTVIVDKNRYSVPTKYAGCKATVLLGANHINIFIFGKKIAAHKRNYNTKQWCIAPDHYLELIR